MLGQSVISGRSSVSSRNRIFVYEVSGLQQNEANDSNSYPFRSSDNVFISVPYCRMNEEMQRIGKMGGNIVNITPLSAFRQQGDSGASQSTEFNHQEDQQKSEPEREE